MTVTRYVTPFENNVLPHFAEWFERISSEVKPDFYIPIERRGARLLDSTLEYLYRQTGLRTRTPILYRRALMFAQNNELQGKRFIVLDDSTRTGRSLNRYRDIVEGVGGRASSLLACVGYVPIEPSNGPSLRDDVNCFMETGSEKYHEYLWQISEMLLAGGLPPEADHHRFRLNVSGEINYVWQHLMMALSDEGQLDVCGPTSRNPGVLTATLHWPKFFSTDILPTNGAIKQEGVAKLRFYMNLAEGSLYVIPMVFPAIEVIPPSGRDSATLQECTDIFDDWASSRSWLGRVLLEEASDSANSCEVLYYAVSLECVVRLLCSFIQRLNDKMSGVMSAVTLQCDTVPFVRLYGERTSSRLLPILRSQIESHKSSLGTISSSNTASPPVSNQDTSGSVHPPTPESVNAEVGRATDDLIRFLKDQYLTRNAGKGKQNWITIGYQFSELLAQADLASIMNNRLLLSRCLDLGCATTSITPFVDFKKDTLPTGKYSLTVGRRYRTSESVPDHNRSVTDHDKEDFRTYCREIAHEVVATVIHFMSKRSRRWNSKPVQPFDWTKTLAIIASVSSKVQRMGIVVVPSKFGPESAYESPVAVIGTERILLAELTSELYYRSSEGYVVTQAYERRLREGSLRLVEYGAMIELQSYLNALVPVIDDATNISNLLTCWSMVANSNLGFIYVMYDVRDGLDKLEKPLNVLAGGRPLDLSRLEKTCKEATACVGIAQSKITILQDVWWVSAEEHLSDPVMEVESTLLASIKHPSHMSAMLEFAAAFCSVTRKFIALVSSLTEWFGLPVQSSLCFEPEVQRNESPIALHNVLHDVTIRLTSFRRDTPVPSVRLSDDLEEVRISVGRTFKETLDLLSRFATAFERRDIVPQAMSVRVRPVGRKRYKFVMFADIAGSYVEGQVRHHDENVSWKNAALNLVANWGRAFGGTEDGHIYSREGDSVCVEFEDTDSAVICAVVVQEHMAALRSVEAKEIAATFHIGIDVNWISDADGGNRISAAIDRAAKLAKNDRYATCDNCVVISPEAAEACSDSMRSFLSPDPEGEVELAKNDPTTQLRPFLADNQQLMVEYLRRIRSDV